MITKINYEKKFLLKIKHFFNKNEIIAKVIKTKELKNTLFI